MSDEHRAAGQDALRALGIPDGSWFVCFHAREGGYSPGDERVHSFRNASVLDLLPAMRVVVERGGWCVRMGDPTMTRLSPLPGVVDYAHHGLRSPDLDVFLCASCRFFLGNTSGLFIVSTSFGRPVALANMTPVTAMAYAPGDLSIYKLVRARMGGRLLRFPELFASSIANYRISRVVDDAGLELVDNSPEDIAELATEMLDRLEGRTDAYTAYAPLQAKFASLARPYHYSYGSTSLIGGRFAGKYRHLIE